LAKARSSDPCAGSGGNGGGSGGSGGSGDDPPYAGSRTDDDKEESMDDINLNWDTFDRSAFGYNRHCPDDIRAEHTRRQPSLEPDWKEIQLNRNDIIYDAATNQVFQ
jgi:hypothetical protein